MRPSGTQMCIAMLAIAVLPLMACESDGESSTPPGTGGTHLGDSGTDAPSGGAGGSAGGTGGGAGVGGAGGGEAYAPRVGREFWAVDLPTSRGGDSTVEEPWSLLVANVGTDNAQVIVEQDDAPLGQPLQLSTISSFELAPGAAQRVVMPTREITGWTPATHEPPGPPMTAVTANAFRVSSNGPITVVQLNPSANDSSPGATSLIPTAQLGTAYRTVGWSTANPAGLLSSPVPGIPDHSSVTVVGVTAQTQVSVTVSAPTLGDGAFVPALAAGETLTVALGPFEVLNIASDGGAPGDFLTGDLSGTVVSASAPVAVFSSGERALVPATDTPQVLDPCCTDHYEEQIPPSGALGTTYLVDHSPSRSEGAFHEDDIVRFVAVDQATTVTTSLPPPDDHFDLAAGALRDVFVNHSFVAEATAPLLVARLLASGSYTTRRVGDPAVTLVSPVDEFQKDFVVLAPPDWPELYGVLVAREGHDVSMDGSPLPPECQTSPLGTLGGLPYVSTTCPLVAGTHRFSASLAFSLTIYGYGPYSAFAYRAAGM